MIWVKSDYQSGHPIIFLDGFGNRLLWSYRISHLIILNQIRIWINLIRIKSDPLTAPMEIIISKSMIMTGILGHE